MDEKQVERAESKVQHFSKEQERLKIYQGVFDEHTLKRLSRLADKGYFTSLDYPISTGKEADVYRATTKNGDYVAIKIYRIETSNFKRMQEYILGDYRFSKGVKHNKRSIVTTWCQKEFRNLGDAAKAGVRVPHPIEFSENLLIMEFIGEKGIAAPVLTKVNPENPEKLIKTLAKYIKDMYQKAGIVHGDLSEFNVLMVGQTPVLIDIGQAMGVKHPRAPELLIRDLYNLHKYAKRIGVKFDHEKAYNDIV